jgi:hypothetical protein
LVFSVSGVVLWGSEFARSSVGMSKLPASAAAQEKEMADLIARLSASGVAPETLAGLANLGTAARPQAVR